MSSLQIFRAVALVAPALCAMTFANSSRASTATRDNLNSWTVDFEVDQTDMTSNTVQRFNNPTTTRFDTVDYTGSGETLGRLNIARQVDWGWKGAELRLEIVPLQYSGTQAARANISFDGGIFKQGVPLNVLYQFNTYRITYDGPIFRDQNLENWSFRLGGTLAIRDAQIRLEQPGNQRSYSNYGPVPLLYAAAVYRFSSRAVFEADLEGLPAPGGGGLIDTSGRFKWEFSRQAGAFIGVRYYAGGANSGSLYDCLHTRSALAGLEFKF